MNKEFLINVLKDIGFIETDRNNECTTLRCYINSLTSKNFIYKIGIYTTHLVGLKITIHNNKESIMEVIRESNSFSAILSMDELIKTFDSEIIAFKRNEIIKEII